MIDDCWRRAREVAARVLTNDMVEGLMKDGMVRVRSRDGEMEMDAVAKHRRPRNFDVRAPRTHLAVEDLRDVRCSRYLLGP